jgi:hypothetical protein
MPGAELEPGGSGDLVCADWGTCLKRIYEQWIKDGQP